MFVFSLSFLVVPTDLGDVRDWFQVQAGKCTGDATSMLQVADQALQSSDVMNACSGAKLEEAEKICAKHFKKDKQEAFFSDCVFDMCNGGTEDDIEDTANLLSHPEDSD